MLFEVSLASHTYTLVAKGTRDVFVPALKHEEQVYDQFDTLQGVDKPICLESIELTVLWPKLGGIRIIDMLLLAYGGRSLDLGQTR